jgi:acyl-coenzyme A thioesterase PaaI-like protein
MGAEAGSFYVQLGEGSFRATELTASPWGPGSQHGGPAAALLGRTLESDAGGEGGIFARLAFEFLGPVPVGELSVEAKTVRPGRRVSLREATLSDGAGRPVMLCRAWRISASPASLPDDLESERPTLPGPEEGKEKPFFEMAPEVGYHRGIEARFVEGSWRDLGSAAA